MVTLTTDFGSADHFVGTMRGVILGINPTGDRGRPLQLDHSLRCAGWRLTLAQAYRYYPPDTTHLVVVDPGVGSARRPLLVTTTRHYFLAPDNGVLSLVMAQEERIPVRHHHQRHYFLQPLSHTFHGRDIFAPCAGWLSKGVEPTSSATRSPTTCASPCRSPRPTGEHAAQRRCAEDRPLWQPRHQLHAAKTLPPSSPPVPSFASPWARPAVSGLRASYSEGQPGELFAILNSMGYLEIACNRGSAAQLAKAGRSVEVTVEF